MSVIDHRAPLTDAGPPTKTMGKVTHAIAHDAVSTLVVRKPKERGTIVEILHTDECFAPGVETTSITYRLDGAADSGRVEIRSKRSGEKPLFERVLEPSELAGGAKLVITWDGKCNAKSGPLAGRFATPLFSPYELRIVVEQSGTTKQASADVRVLYHSMHILPAPWTPDGKPPEMTDGAPVQQAWRLWVQYRLNELGYWAGVVGNETDDCPARAIVRYKMNHHAFHESTSGLISPSIDTALVKALKRGDSRRRFLEVEGGGDAFAKGATTRIYVEAMLAERGEESVVRQAVEADRLNRPTLALETEILLRSRSGKPVSSPKAVGPVRVNFRVHDVGEDLSRQVLRKNDEHHPALARLYVKKARKETGDGDVDLNCPVSHGGIRTKSTPWADAALLGSAYACYETSSDAGKKVVKTKACVDKSFGARRGRAGFVFRPSIIGGDGYRIEAELDFSDEPNAKELDEQHSKGIRTETGEIRIWRWLPLAGVIRWTKHPSDEAWDLGDYAKEFARAYTKVELPESKHPVPITEVLGNDEYLDGIEKVGLKRTEFELKQSGIWGGKLPVMEKAETWLENMTKLDGIRDDAQKILLKHALGAAVHHGALRHFGPGVVLAEFGLHERLTLWDAGKVFDPAFQTSAGARGFGEAIGVAWILDDLDDPTLEMDRRWIVCHEIGHTLYLQHYENTPQLYDQDAKSTPDEHDAADHACLMSYADNHPHKPHFCGRCNLNLRGWNVKKIPERSR
jgi:hypothetical protein